MKRFYLFACILAGGMLSCVDGTGPEPTADCKAYVAFTQPIHKYCYVLCDFSKSQLTDSFLDMRKNAALLFEQISSEYRVSFLRIGYGYGEPVFFKYKPADKMEIENDLEVDNRNNYQLCMKDSLERKLAEMTRLQTGNTCIISALERVKEEIETEVSNRTDTVKIVILSDLIEACDRNGKSINLANRAAAALEKIMQPGFLPSLSFDTYRHLRGSFVISTKSDSLEGDKLRKFWKAAFEQLHIPMEGAFSTSLPAWTSLNKE